MVLMHILSFIFCSLFCLYISVSDIFFNTSVTPASLPSPLPLDRANLTLAGKRRALDVNDIVLHVLYTFS